MRQSLILAAFLFVSSVLASQPGQPLDCSDWVFLEPGYRCVTVLHGRCPNPPNGSFSGNPPCGTQAKDQTVTDNQWRRINVQRTEITESDYCGPGTPALFGAEIMIYDGSKQVLVAQIRERCGPGETVDIIGSGYHLPVRFDHLRGRLIIETGTTCYEADPLGDCQYSGAPWYIAIEGFPTLFDVLQSYSPSKSSLTVPVPYMPEGFEAADWFDTYWGSVTHPLNLADAHPLQCEYPPTPPKLGDRLTIADTVPTPAPGSAVYYVTAVNFQGQRRAGRRSQAGVLSGRDAAALPACNQQ